MNRSSIKSRRMLVGLVSLLLFAALALGYTDERLSLFGGDTKIGERKTVEGSNTQPTDSSRSNILNSVDLRPQTTTQFDVSSHVIAGGGGTSNGVTSTGAPLKVEGTIGQSVAGTTSNSGDGQFSVTGGFWQSGEATTPGNTTIQFLSSMTFVGEASVDAVVTVARGGDTSGTSTIDYRTTDTDNFTVGCGDTVNNMGSAFGRCDFATSLDTLTFSPGETSKTFIVPIIDDSYAEGNETFAVVLSNPAGANFGSPSTATVSIVDNDSADGPNPIFNTPFFVRQHYLDFLSREPEPAGFNAWVNLLNNCSDVNNNPACDRLRVSESFFGSQEFQLKGYYVYRFYKLAFDRLPTYAEIVVDMRTVTGQTPDEVFQKKAAFANAFVLRQEFTNIYNSTSNAVYVSMLMNRYGLTQITTPDPASPDGANKVSLTTADLTNQLNTATLTRAQVLRAIADSDEVLSREFNQAFVAMQYFGYLRRTPEPSGYNAWLNYLNTHPTDFRTMIRGFMDSDEYRLRFGP